MNISPITKPRTKATSVIITTDTTYPKTHPFVQGLPASDKAYIQTYLKKLTLSPPSNEVLLLPSGERIIIIGTAVNPQHPHRTNLSNIRNIVKTAKREHIEHIQIATQDIEDNLHMNASEWMEVIATHLTIANFEFTAYKTPPAQGWSSVQEVYVLTKPFAGSSEALKRGSIIGEEINKSRQLSNTPGSDMTPTVLAREAIRVGKAYGIAVKVLEEEAIKKLQMGGVLGVSKGSSERPRFIVMEYLKGEQGQAPVVLAGKGVTFDTGGLNLKPSEGIYEMHMDMSGGAAVIHTIAALARLKVRKNIIGLIPAVENMPSGSSYHPGDLLKTMSGKTIEVLNTDAEGRVILSDALEYAKQYKPRLVVDVATLTGAAMIALGQRSSAIFTTDEKLEHQLRVIGEQTGDVVWPLPLWEEFEPDIKGTFGDVANLGKTKYGGAITGAVFLWQFIKGYPWVHIDIAPRMTTIEGDHLAKGSAGAAVQLLTHFLRSF